ncbi:extensin-like domain-containing protein [Siccibacter turicensis]|uniref:extensin-like domain-containing protein n=1 Tax=Siccibacter turicensis TaxID=357233 RepID=UPI003F5796C6
MKTSGGLVTGILIVALAGYWLYDYLPPQYNPFTPLSPGDPPTLVTRYKMRALASQPDACMAVLREAQAQNMIAFRQAADTRGNCPLSGPVRVSSFGDVALSSSFLASCPLALSSAMYVHQRAAPAAKEITGSTLTRIDHLGSFACRNIYNRPGARLSEHATAEALDISGFRLANGERLSVARDWNNRAQKGTLLRQLFSDSCAFYGNSLGPEYNAAHADHFHLGMRGFGICR